MFNDLTRAERDVIAERRAHTEREGWTPEHDDEHRAGELAMAGALYALNTTDVRANAFPRTPYSSRIPLDLPYYPYTLWPWHAAWWKPTDRRRDLVKAATLILAEIERLDRVNPPMQPPTRLPPRPLGFPDSVPVSE